MSAIAFMLAFYTQEDYWLSFVLTISNYSYWLVILASMIRNRDNETEK